MTRAFLLVLVLLAALRVNAQLEDRQRSVTWSKEWIQLDTLSLVPSSVVILSGCEGCRIEYDARDGIIKLVPLTTPADAAVVLRYRVFPFAFGRKYNHRSLDQYDKKGVWQDQRVAPVPGLTRQTVLKDQVLQKSGSLTRGVTAGNAQNMTVQSSMNLMLEGKLSEDVRLKAVLSDQHVPYQPEGNTQNIQQLDQMLIELTGKHFAAGAGDLVFRSEGTQFLRYNRNTKGITLSGKTTVAGGEWQGGVSLGMVKGRFSIVNVPVAEGVQGPYRVPGPNGESFVTVIANSERVFFDGRQLERGFNADYVIDYNLGEITFMNRVIVTRYSRVRIEYQYTNLSYQRTLTQVSQRWKKDRTEVSVQWFNEKDNPFQPVGGALSDLDLQKLALADGAGVYLPRVDSGSFSTNGIFYRKVDTLDNEGIRHQIYVRSSDPARAHYQVRFSRMGPGMGNYMQRSGVVGGTYYEWVAPAQGVPQGEFEPVSLLPAPMRQQMLEVQARVKVTEYESAYVTTAWLDKNQNILSETGRTRMSGYALVTGISSSQRAVAFLPGYRIQSFLEAEYDDKNFQGIDRFRSVDFDRDWSVSTNATAPPANDRFLRSGITLEKQGSDNQFNYRLSLRDRKGMLSGTQHTANWLQQIGKVKLEGSGFSMNSAQGQYLADWKRLDAGISLLLPGVVPGYTYRMNRNTMSLSRNDSLVSSAMNFREHYFSLRNAVGATQEYQLSHSIREDEVPSLGEMHRATLARTSQLMLKRAVGAQQVNAVFTFRQVDNLQALATKREESLTGRLDWQGSWLKKVLRSDLTYAVSNGRELKRTYAFVQVPAGQGTHTWRDDNHDGKPDINEFYEAINFDEKNYIKVYLPGTDFVPAYSNLVNFRLAMEAPAFWKQGQGLRRALSRLSANHVLLSDNKVTDDALHARLLSALLPVEGSQLLAGKQSLRSMIFFNRANPVFGADVIFNRNNNKRMLSQGMESLSTQSAGMVIRYNAGPEQMWRLSTEQGRRAAASDFMAGRTYDVAYRMIAPEWAWQPGTSFRASWKFTWQQRTGSPVSGESVHAAQREWSTDARWNKTAGSSFQAVIRLIDIDYDGERNTALGYEMLNALNPGRNYTWTVNAVHKLVNGIQINLNYEGRKSPGASTVHVGRVMVTALF
ncbi:MAG: hypothetical protein U0V64_10885 [Cyclobacteriaceae bacterium]